MSLSKDMLAVLASYKDGTQTGTPYAPELCDLGLLMCFEDQYVCTQAGIQACKPQEPLKPHHLYVLSHVQCFQYSPADMPEAARQLVELGFLDDEWLITASGRVQLSKGLVL